LLLYQKNMYFLFTNIEKKRIYVRSINNNYDGDMIRYAHNFVLDKL
jgi:hypothetical protein